ncbi:MAG: hypothetical protein A3K31_00140 [Ignavibacteria bacterium RIFOXYA12_FULL_35_25]|nr:MAG: hypothetical protein A2X60_13440 [Ignavibacteria bacterium GWF2_35_20]OGU79779.1 MAG: hypothetical protein A2254_16995 [Ignavibacteria bacterium RIFOXYA2_FULL_35_9]OGU90543.1 MAG: hypothetical protein A3K31_00140 [Ignavibacteria bacterium RIFOXYA12_FULL_35_25]OGV30910.1 MAG: hypothetical protein A2523_07980 [Ignavibacteria bacterium RIFOXYD12_FULL_36_8]
MIHNLIFIQWTNNFGGLEKISQLYEGKFHYYNPLVVILQYNKSGLNYKNFYAFYENSKPLFIYSYLLFVRKNRKSIFHIQYAGTTILLLTFLAGARKIIFHFHGTKFPNNYFNKLIWKQFKNKVIIIANSLHTKKIIKDRLKINTNISIIPNLIDLHEFKFIERVYNNGERFTVTFAGRFDKGKNIDLILATAKTLIHYDDEIEFLLVGDGPEKGNIERQIKENQLESVVKILPFTKEILEIYYRSHLFIFTSLYESFGNVVAEAVLTGLPILCYKIPALTELINDDFFFIENQDPNFVAEKIIEFKKNYMLVNQRLKKVFSYLSEYLNNEIIVDKLDSIYKGLSIKR